MDIAKASSATSPITNGNRLEALKFSIQARRQSVAT
jgi:hypothetical protein